MEIQQNQQQTIQQQIEQQFNQFIQPKLVLQPTVHNQVEQQIVQPTIEQQPPHQNELINNNNNSEEALVQSNVMVEQKNEQINTPPTATAPITTTTITTTTTNNIISPVPKKRGRPPKNPLAASGSTAPAIKSTTEEIKEGHPTKQQKLNSSSNIVDNIFEYNNIEEDETSFQCPICKNKFPKEQIDQHYQYELKKLDSGTTSESGSLSSSASSTPTLNQVNLALFSSTKIRTPRKASLDAIIKSRFTESGREFDKINSTLSSIKQNREKRCNVNGIPLSSISNNIVDQSSSSSSSSVDSTTASTSASAPITCFLCNLELTGTTYEMNCHVDECLKNQNNTQIPSFKTTLEPQHLINSSSNIVSSPSPSLLQQLPPQQPLQRKRGRPSKQQQLQREQEQDQQLQQKQKKKNDSSSEDEVYNEDDFKDLPPGAQVYEFAGQVRIRTCSLLPNGYTGVLFDKKLKTSEKDDIEDDLDIEDDDTLKFGSVQYSEEDLNEDKNNDSSTAKNTTSTTTTTTTTNSSTNSNIDEEIGISGNNNSNQANSADDNGFNNNVNSFQNINSSNAFNSINNNSFLVESLKQKLKDQEQLLKDTPSCLICMGAYRIPLVSINCWHVHCEDCWLGTLKVKKWCPQCNIITCPQDLRKIYL